MITENTSFIGIYNGSVDDLIKPFKNSAQLEWAKRLARIYLKFGRLFKLRADLAFAQGPCHETGLLTFTGIAKPSWNNFAGIGITGAGAVQKFKTEDLGVVAHYAHLAWYYYPNHVNSMCSKEFDPRHFGNNHYMYNGDTSIQRLTGSWAVPGKYKQPDGSWITYAQKIAYYANIINGESNQEPNPEPLKPSEPSKPKPPKPKILLRKGDKDEEVKQLQKYLTSKGYWLAPDGIFGNKTETAIKNYQRDNGLEITGYITKKDMEAMNGFVIVKPDKFDIIVQMGHIGRKTGATGTYREQEFTQKLGNAMYPLLKASGLKFRIMGADDWLKPEPNECTIFFALHYDGSTNKDARGFSCGFKIGTNQRFKDVMAVSYRELSGFTRRPDNYTSGLRNYYAWTLKGSRMVHHVEADFYCLLEHGFGTCNIEREWMFVNIDNIARHHAEVIVRFLNDTK